MTDSRTLIIFWGLALLSANLVFLEASPLSIGTKDSGQIKAVATVYPLKEFAQAVLGDKGDVILLLPPGAEIHSWRPRPSDIRKISQSDLFLCIGAGLEPWVDDILNAVNRSKLQIFRASEGMTLMERPEHGQKTEGEPERGHGLLDPHIWLDFGLDQVIIDKLIVYMADLMPEEAAYFKANGEAYKKRLCELDKRFEEVLSGCKEDTFIMGGHAAFGYLAKRYHLHQISLYGLSPDSTPAPGTMVRVVELAKAHDIQVVYFEINISDDLAKVIAQEIGASVLVLSPAANITLDQRQSGATFFDIMTMNLKNLQEGLDCE
jgi:zinc transport system substrate-binding protein